MENVRERLGLYYGGLARVSADSGAEGKGTQIRISLPRAAIPAEA
jgi:sensor histidine kinase YesM